MQFGNLNASQNPYKRLKLMAYTGMALSIVALVLVAALSVELSHGVVQRSSSTSNLAPIFVTGPLITPPLSLPDAPPITTQEAFGQRLTDINVPMNSSQLAVINDEPNSYFDTAARMWLNGSLTSLVGQQVAAAPLLTVNGKPTVVYLGAISCVYCGENRWAMALALSRFGVFQNLFLGYSSFGDQDVPTVYWAPAHYNATSAVDFGNFFSGTYVNFLSIDYASPITAGFEMQTLPYFQQQATAVNNTVYERATSLLVALNNFAGTPYTIWGRYSVLGADATDFGDVTSTSTSTTSSASASSTTSTTSTGTLLPLASMTHEQVLASLANPDTPFAWTEYAAADYYVALICSSLGVISTSSTTAPPVCSEPNISSMTTTFLEAG
ncbi:MAG: DUF929 domain-containing protein [Thaumarchaeota archaeon]|nr:DUF929 domain-containing protein [Nitrososphaerota archaeon]